MHFHSRRCIWKFLLENGGHFCIGLNVLYNLWPMFRIALLSTCLSAPPSLYTVHFTCYANVGVLIEFHELKFVPLGTINCSSVLVLVMAWRRTGDNPIPEPSDDPLNWYGPPCPSLFKSKPEKFRATCIITFTRSWSTCLLYFFPLVFRTYIYT